MNIHIGYCDVCGLSMEYDDDFNIISLPDCGMADCPSSYQNNDGDNPKELNFSEDPVSNLDREVKDPWEHEIDDLREEDYAD